MNVCLLVLVYTAIKDMKLDVSFVKMSDVLVLLFQGVHTVRTLFPTSPQQQSSLKRTARLVVFIHSVSGMQIQFLHLARTLSKPTLTHGALV